MEIAKDRAETEFEKYRVVQNRLFASNFDKLIDSKKTEDSNLQILHAFPLVTTI